MNEACDEGNNKITLKNRKLVVRTAAEMLKVILMDSETLLRKVLSRLVQSD